MVQALQLKIKGMTCAACAQASERAVKKLPGVEEAAVNFTTEKLLVKFEAGTLTDRRDQDGRRQGGLRGGRRSRGQRPRHPHRRHDLRRVREDD